MTVPVWQPGTTYAPGALVVPRSASVPAFTGLTNADLSLTTGWDLATPLQILNDGAGYNGQGRIAAQGTTAGALALNQAHVPVNPGQVVSASAMCAHGTSDDHSSDAGLTIVWYNSSDVEVGTPADGDGVPRLSNAGWQLISVSGTAPASTAYCRIGVSMFRNGTDTIQVSGFQLNYTPQAAARAEMYEATQTNPGKSGSTEPVWPGAGLTVVDNEVTWNGVNIDRLVWQASPLLTSGTTEPTWPDAAGGVVHDGTIDWVAVVPYITDPNCPNTPVVAIMASKVFAADKDIVRFCATANASDWTAQLDAGYLPTGLQQANANDMAVLAPYRSNLTAFNASSFQNWQVDPDPAQMALLDQMEGIGSTYQHAAHPVGNELFYLSQLGVRSVSISAGSDNLQAGDVGMPVDSMVQDAIRVASANGTDARATYYPGAGQYWLTFAEYPPPTLAISGHLPDSSTFATPDYQYTVSGGVKPYGNVNLASGALPTGLSMDSSGRVTGTFTATGSFAWSISTTDADGNVATLNDSCTVFETAALLDFNTSLTTDPTGTVWTVESGTIVDRWGLQPVTMPVLVATPSMDGSAMQKAPDTDVHDGTFDYLGTENLGVVTALGAKAFGTATDFCIEMYVWLNLVDGRGQSESFASFGTATGVFSFGVEFGVNSGLGLPWPMINTLVPGGLTRTLWAPPSPPTRQFFHFAVTRKGDILSCWFNGVKYAEYSGASAMNIRATDNIVIGNGQGGAGTTLGWPGSFDDVRLTSGWFRYDENFTPPAVPYQS